MIPASEIEYPAKSKFQRKIDRLVAERSDLERSLEACRLELEAARGEVSGWKSTCERVEARAAKAEADLQRALMVLGQYRQALRIQKGELANG